MSQTTLILDGLQQQYDCETYSDYAVRIYDSRIIRVHKVILAAGSPYFRRHFSEHPLEVVYDVTDRDIPADTMEAALKWLYGVPVLDKALCRLTSFDVLHCKSVHYAAGILETPSLHGYINSLLVQLFGTYLEEKPSLCENPAMVILQDARTAGQQDAEIRVLVAEYCREHLLRVRKLPRYHIVLEEYPRLALAILEAVAVDRERVAGGSEA